MCLKAVVKIKLPSRGVGGFPHAEKKEVLGEPPPDYVTIQTHSKRSCGEHWPSIFETVDTEGISYVSGSMFTVISCQMQCK